jgi:hypothetical protein
MIWFGVFVIIASIYPIAIGYYYSILAIRQRHIPTGLVEYSCGQLDTFKGHITTELMQQLELEHSVHCDNNCSKYINLVYMD